MELTPEMLAVGAVWYIVFLFSTTCHEAAHALAAKLGGDPTAYHGGQVTLNPMPHIEREPFGTVFVPLISYAWAGWMFGWASAPYDPIWERRYPRRAAWMALAGPGANFLLMLIAAVAIRVGVSFGYFRMPQVATFTSITEAVGPEATTFLTTLLSVTFVLNLLLGTFNLLPAPPLDGNSAITLMMSEQMALKFLDASRAPGFGLAGLLLAWIVFDRIFGFLFTLALNLLYPGANFG